MNNNNNNNNNNNKNNNNKKIEQKCASSLFKVNETSSCIPQHSLLKLTRASLYYISRDPITRVICYHYFPPCGNVTHFKPPNALCRDICDYIIERVCPLTFMIAALNLQFINCSRPGFALGSLPHCCSDAGIRIGT